MAEQLPETARDMPRVIFAQRVVDKILRGALLYPGTETGEALIGLIVPQQGRQEPDIYVLDTIGPGEHAVREWGKFEQGDDWQGDVLHWMHVNWEAFRELRRPSYGNALAAKWDVPLMHVGDWHKQPGDMIEPSLGDENTARLMIADAETPVKHIIAPIVTLYPLGNNAESAPAAEPTAQAPSITDENAGPDGEPENETVEVVAAGDPLTMPEQHANTIVRNLEDEGWTVRVDCWYMSTRVRRFVPVALTIWPDERLPGLPPVAWHLAYPRRFDQEFRLLRDAGYMVDVVRFDADGKPPYEICFSVYKRGSKHVILLVTSVDYPVQMPAVRAAPLVSVTDDEDVFEKLYAESRSLLLTELPDWEWDSKRTLIELVWHVEQVLGDRADENDENHAQGGAE